MRPSRSNIANRSLKYFSSGCLPSYLKDIREIAASESKDDLWPKQYFEDIMKEYPGWEKEDFETLYNMIAMEAP